MLDLNIAATVGLCECRRSTGESSLKLPTNEDSSLKLPASEDPSLKLLDNDDSSPRALENDEVEETLSKFMRTGNSNSEMMTSRIYEPPECSALKREKQPRAGEKLACVSERCSSRKNEEQCCWYLIT